MRAMVIAVLMAVSLVFPCWADDSFKEGAQNVGQGFKQMGEDTGQAIKEVGKVLDLIKSLRDHGVAVIIISHRMDDIFYACDRVMALYQGSNFAEAPLKDTTRNEVIGWIMGTKGHSETLAHDKVH